jgi:chromosome segregation ATPase
MEKQIRIMEKNYNTGNSSTAINDQSEMSEIMDKIRDIFDIPDQEDVFSELEKVRIEIETIEPIKHELEKAQRMYEDLKSKHEKYLSKKSEQNMNDYTQELINSKNQELEYLNNELTMMRQKYDEIENAFHDLKHEKNLIQNQMNEMQRILNDREKEIGRLRQENQGLQQNTLEYKEVAKKLMIDKKDLESELQRLGSQDDLQRSKTAKDIEGLKTESSSLVSFILTLQLAHDEEFENLFKNQSYANEFDQARKHLENQKDIVDTLVKKLLKDMELKIKEVQDYKLYITDLENQIEDVGGHKAEAIKWKQCYERLTITLKNTKDNHDVESVLAEYEKVQNLLEKTKAENAKLSEALDKKEFSIGKLSEDIIHKERKIEHMQAQIKSHSNSESHGVNTQNSQLLLKLEKDIKRLEGENDRLKDDLNQYQKSSLDLSEKYKLSVEKSVRQDQLEHMVGQLEPENIKLRDQVTVLKKENTEQKKILDGNMCRCDAKLEQHSQNAQILTLHEPTELMTTINTLKSSLNKRENKIKEIEAEKNILENLLDEARLEIQNQSDSESQRSERATFNDAIEILDTIASKPLGLSSSNKSQEFNSVMKRLLLVKEQTEEPIVAKIVSYLKDYLPTEFGDQRDKCVKFNDQKALLIDTLGSIRDQF